MKRPENSLFLPGPRAFLRAGGTLFAACLLASSLWAHATPVVDGITFASSPGKVYLPVQELKPMLGWCL